MVNKTNLGLKLQELPSVIYRILVTAEIVGLRNAHGWFAPRELIDFFDALRLPQPSNVSQSLSHLKKKDLVVRRSSGQWALTPIGREKVLEVFGSIDAHAVEAQLIGTPGAEFAHVHHPVIHPVFAPPRWTDGIARLLGSSPFETNVFCMTRFPRDAHDTEYLDPVQEVIEVLREVALKHGLNLLLASDRQIDDDLLGNVAAHMWVSQYGIGLLEDRVGRGLNYNVVTELGAMLMTGRRCGILKDVTAPELPSDLGGQIYKSVDFDRLEIVCQASHRWFAQDLCLGRCDKCP